MCKTGKKNYNNLFFYGFNVSRTNEKKRMKKKKCRGAGMGYCPFFVLGHDTIDCIVTQGLGGRAGRAWPGARLSECVLGRAAVRATRPSALRHSGTARVCAL